MCRKVGWLIRKGFYSLRCFTAVVKVFVLFFFTGLGVCGFTAATFTWFSLMSAETMLGEGWSGSDGPRVCVCVCGESGTRISREKLMFTPQIDDRLSSLSLLNWPASPFAPFASFPPRCGHCSEIPSSTRFVRLHPSYARSPVFAFLKFWVLTCALCVCVCVCAEFPIYLKEKKGFKNRKGGTKKSMFG